MCAIAGAIGGSEDGRAALGRMLDAMRHRGPDDSGRFFDGDARLALGHNRLAILDLTTAGRQPMTSDVNGDVLSFNGEIYNHRELRDELEGLRWRFRSRCDTEVLLHAFGEWGLGALDRIEGMFALALWRPREQALYLARDPQGIKPLYWRVENETAFFSSEIGGLVAGAKSASSLDRLALGQFLEFGYTFEDERTCLEGVRKLPPGHYLRLTAQAPDARPTRYWRPDLTPRPESETQLAVEELARDAPSCCESASRGGRAGWNAAFWRHRFQPSGRVGGARNSRAHADDGILAIPPRRTPAGQAGRGRAELRARGTDDFARGHFARRRRIRETFRRPVRGLGPGLDASGLREGARTWAEGRHRRRGRRRVVRRL